MVVVKSVQRLLVAVNIVENIKLHQGGHKKRRKLSQIFEEVSHSIEYSIRWLVTVSLHVT